MLCWGETCCQVCNDMGVFLGLLVWQQGSSRQCTPLGFSRRSVAAVALTQPCTWSGPSLYSKHVGLREQVVWLLHSSSSRCVRPKTGRLWPSDWA